MMKAKKIFRKIIACVLLAVMLTGSVSAASYTAGAKELDALGLFDSTKDGYDLDREVTIAEAIVMFVRLLGKEAEAKEMNYKHPFTNVPDWADAYVGYFYHYAYGNNFIDDEMYWDEFYLDGECYAEDFCALILLALGYSDEALDYDNILDFAEEIGIIDDSMYISSYWFTRDDCVALMYNALNIKIKGTNTTLLDKLVADKAVDRKAAKNFKEKNAAVADLNKSLQSSIMATMAAVTDQPFNMSFDISVYIPAYEFSFEDEIAQMLEDEGYDLEDMTEWLAEYNIPEIDLKLKMSISVIGEEIAVVISVDYMDISGDISVYYTGGYAYIDYMGEKKIKYEIDPEEMAIGNLFADFGIFDIEDIIGALPGIPAAGIDDISKIVTNKNIFYKIGIKEDSGDGYSVDGAMDIVFNRAGGEFSSFNIRAKISLDDMLPYFKNYYIKLQIGAKLITGAKVKLNFPDFADYIEIDEEDIFSLLENLENSMELSDLSDLFYLF